MRARWALLALLAPTAWAATCWQFVSRQDFPSCIQLDKSLVRPQRPSGGPHSQCHGPLPALHSACWH
jgi:hypothetical protein